ncbi:MAG: hypothetical protein SWH68_01300 [Thermodesulfobacteriota bacterium]|nr:hypothetical protein [Thermodesulfobacteriota bacterium]
MKKFLLLSSQRSASTYVSLWLNGHPAIESHSEVFLPHYGAPDGFARYCDRRLYRKVCKWLFLNRAAQSLPVNFTPYTIIESYLVSLFHAPHHSGPWSDIRSWNEHMPRKPGSDCIGFKLMYSQLKTYPQLMKWLIRNKDVRILHLIRTNHLKTFISIVRKAETKLAHTDRQVKTRPVHINLKQLWKFIQKQEARVQFHRALFSRQYPYYEFTTEAFFSKRNTIENDIFRFLNIPACNIPQPGLKQISSSRIENEIANYQDVINSLEPTEYAYLLTDFIIR